MADTKKSDAVVVLGLGIDDTWAKAISRRHGRILTRIGVQHVVFPEHDMGERVAHLVVSGRPEQLERFAELP